MFWGKETPYASSITKKVIFLVCNGLCLTLSGKSLSAGALGKLGRPSEEPGLWSLLVFCGAYGWKGTKDVLIVFQLPVPISRPNA